MHRSHFNLCVALNAGSLSCTWLAGDATALAKVPLPFRPPTDRSAAAAVALTSPQALESHSHLRLIGESSHVFASSAVRRQSSATAIARLRRFALRPSARRVGQPVVAAYVAPLSGLHCV